jgi:hypothetical protein
MKYLTERVIHIYYLPVLHNFATKVQIRKDNSKYFAFILQKNLPRCDIPRETGTYTSWQGVYDQAGYQTAAAAIQP